MYIYIYIALPLHIWEIKVYIYGSAHIYGSYMGRPVYIQLALKPLKKIGKMGDDKDV